MDDSVFMTPLSLNIFATKEKPHGLFDTLKSYNGYPRLGLNLNPGHILYRYSLRQIADPSKVKALITTQIDNLDAGDKA